MTSPLAPNFNYVNGSLDSALWIKKTDAITTPSPFTVKSANGEQSVRITATGTGPQGIVMRNDALDPDGVVAVQMSVDGKAQVQTIAGITELLDPVANVGNGLQNAQLNIRGAAGSLTKIEQIGDISRITNPKMVVDGALQFYASTNSVQYVLAPRDKDASIKIYNSTFFTSSRSTEIGLSEGGVGYVRVNGGGEFVIQEPTVLLGDGISNSPQILVSGLPGTGRVYDTLYNRIAAREYDAIAGPSFPAGTYDFPITLPRGKYQMQVMVKLYQSVGNPIVEGTSLEIWTQRRAGVSPNQYRNFSEIHVKPTMIQLPENDTSNEPTFVSGLFQVNEDDEEWAVWVRANGNWNLGEGSAGAGLYVEYHRISAITEP
jgi:hypothetical protein